MIFTSTPRSIARVMNVRRKLRCVNRGKESRLQAFASAFRASPIAKSRSFGPFPLHNFSTSGLSCGKTGIEKPVSVLRRCTMIRPAERSTWARVSALTSAWPNPARPMNSMKSPLCCASQLNLWPRMSATIALNCSKVGVSRIGLLRLRYLSPAAGFSAMILSLSAISSAVRITLVAAL